MDREKQTLQTDEHDDAGFSFFRSERGFPGIEDFAELVEDGLLDDPALVVAGGEVVEVDDALDVGLHFADELELHIGLEERARDVVEAIVEDFLVDDGRIAHLLKSTRNAPT